MQSQWIVGLLIIIMLCVVQHPAALAQPNSMAAAKLAINVKDFGARGDGKTDDTRAIQMAVNAAAKRDKTASVVHSRSPYKHVAWVFQARPEIIFPAGTYIVSKPIALERYASLRGVGKVIIRQTNATEDIFYFYVDQRGLHESCLFSVENLQLEGGKTQLRLWTNNSQSAQIYIDHCRFSDSSDYAVVCRSYGKPGWDTARYLALSPAQKRAALKAGIYWPPYKIKWIDGLPQLTPNGDKGPNTNNSTVLSLAYCQFNNCMGAANLSCDDSIIQDCSVTVNPQMDGAVFDLDYGEPHLYRVKASAKPAAEKHPYWIKASSILSVRDSDFDVASGAGIDFIRIPENTRDSFGWNCLSVDNCRVKCGGSPENSLVWIANKIQPNIISLTHITETSGLHAKAIVWENSDSLADLVDYDSTFHPTAMTPVLRDQYKIDISGNSANIDTTIPKILQPLLEKPIPQSALQETDVPELNWQYADLEKEFSKVLLATNYGVDNNPQTDDTAALQRLFDAAGRAGKCEVVFAAGVYTLSQPISLPPNIIVRAAGMAVFEQAHEDVDIFHIANAQKVAFKNCIFESGRYGVDISTREDTKARIVFDRSWFCDQRIGIRCLAGDGGIAEKNNTELLFQYGLFHASQALVTNAAHSQLDTSWMFSGADLENQGCFENRGGTMRIQGILGNPASLPGQKMLNNVRWIDNWGKLYVTDTRFGGESGGICNVYNRSNNGAVYIGGGLSRFYNDATKKCILYLEKTPRVAVLQNISSVPIISGHPRYLNSSRVLHADGVDMDHVFAAGVMTPQANAE